MRILAIISAEYGKRHVDNLRAHGPDSWQIETWQAPAILPPVIDYPEDYLPKTFAPADLLLSFAEHRGVAELVPDIAGMAGVKGVIAAVDNEAWLPRGLARQLRGWLEKMDIPCATPKPLCSLTEFDFGVTRRQRITYHSPRCSLPSVIAEFARYFGQPNLKIQVDPETRTIREVEVIRDAVCGCARYAAQGLLGISVDEAEEKAGLLHHHYPCLASMGKDPDFGDTLMHVSGNVLRDNVGDQIRPYKRIQYISPGTRTAPYTESEQQEHGSE